ncbi:MAG: hypothetical protein AAF039_11630 [Bacteroidota bacterium]
MIENELIALWQSSPKHEQIKFERSKLMLEVQDKLDSFDRAVKRRDWIEIGAAIFIVVPLFAYETYRQPNYLTKFGAIWIIMYCFYVTYRLLKAKKNKPQENCSYLEYLKQSKGYLEKQKNLLQNVTYWYILPALIGAIIMLTGMSDLLNKSWQEIIRIKKLWKMLPIMILITVFIDQINKRAVKKELLPRIKKVNELIHLMEEK